MKINCDCLEKVKEKLTIHMNEKDPKIVKESVEWSSIPALMFDGSDRIPYMTLTYKKDGIKRDYDTQVFVNNCPFCGKKYTK